MTRPPEDMIKKTLTYLTLLAAVGLAHAAETFHQGPFNPAEKALMKKGYYMEVFETAKPSGHMLGKIGAPGKPTNDVVIFNFGIEDSQAARAEGRSMRAFNYAPAQAEQFLFAEGWDKYHDRFFTRAYVQEGMDAFAGK
jgi:hypothetical protein